MPTCMLYTVETQTRAPDAWLEVGRAPVTLETVSDAMWSGLVIDRGGDSAGVFLSNQACPTASRALCELHLPAWNRKIRYHRNIPPPWTPCGFRMPPCHTIHRAVSGVWRGRMPGGLKPVSHRVSVWVLSCVMDFPVSDAPRNTAGAALQNTSGAALVFDAVRATHESSARNTAGAANSAGAALVLNAVRATHEPSARKQGASAMNGRRGSGLRCRKVRGALCWRWWESKEKNIRTLVKTLMSVLTYSIRSAVQKAALRHNVVSAGFCAPM